MNFLARAWKTFVFAGLLLVYVCIGMVIRLLVWHPKERRLVYQNFLHRMCRVLLVVLGVEVTVEGKENLRPGQRYFIVANHMSYLDPLLLAALSPTAFVTSIEMRDAFFLGTFTKLAGSFYVERRSRGNLLQEVNEVEQALRDHFQIGVFPEATSTDGSKILPFKRPLFAAAIRGGRSILPVAIQYEKINGHPVTRANHQLLCWYGDMPFFAHSMKLLGLHRIDIRLRILPEIPVAADSDRDTIAEAAFRAINGHYRPLV